MIFKLLHGKYFGINLRNQYIIKQNLLCNEGEIIFCKIVSFVRSLLSQRHFLFCIFYFYIS